MATEAAQMPFDPRSLPHRFHDVPPGLPLIPRIKGQACWIGSTLLERLNVNSRRKDSVTKGLAKVRASARGFAGLFLKSQEDVETKETYFHKGVPLQEQWEMIVEVGGPTLRIRRHEILTSAKIKAREKLHRLQKEAEEKPVVTTLFDSRSRSRRIAVRAAAALTGLLK